MSDLLAVVLAGCLIIIIIIIILKPSSLSIANLSICRAVCMSVAVEDERLEIWHSPLTASTLLLFGLGNERAAS